MNEPSKDQRFVQNMNWMMSSANEVESMTGDELAESLCELDHYHMSSLESWLFSEVVFRLQHPFTWRVRRIGQKINARYSAWQYLRRRK